jgi:hypothetical protein
MIWIYLDDRELCWLELLDSTSFYIITPSSHAVLQNSGLHAPMDDGFTGDI